MSDELKIKLLVVDDEQSIRRLCMTIGGSLGFLCQEAESAEAGITRLETDPPDLVLTAPAHVLVAARRRETTLAAALASGAATAAGSKQALRNFQRVFRLD